MDRRRKLLLLATGWMIFHAPVPSRHAQGATELKLDKDFLAGVVEKLPPSPFEKKGQYKGTVHSYRLLAIDHRLRRFLAACQVEGEFRPPVSGPVSEHISRSDDHTNGLRRFRFEIKAGVYVEAGPDATPRFRVDVEDIKKTELEGIVGLLANLLGKYFDDMMTQIADSRAAVLSQKLNAEVAKRAEILKQYGAFCGIDYLPDQVVLRFDVTRFKREGILGYVFSTAAPGTVPLYRWIDQRGGGHQYTLKPHGPAQATASLEGVGCHVLDHPTAGAAPVYAWHGRFDHLYTLAADGEGVGRRGFYPAGVAFYLLSEPAPDTVPFYRFFDLRNARHFYTTHPHAEFAK